MAGRAVVHELSTHRATGQTQPIGGRFRPSILRLCGLLLAMTAISTPAMAQDEHGLSSLDISRCAGRIGVDLRSVDEAFVAFALDGVPWISAEEAEVSVGTQSVSTTITGSGWLRRRGGTVTYFRYTCLLDANRQALMAHMGVIERRVGDSSPPATTISGTASFPTTPPLPRGIELRVQMLDTSGPVAELMAEQVVRSGWPQPIPFALRIPNTVSLKERKLALSARAVLAHRTIFALTDPRPLDLADLERPIELVLDPPPAKP